MVSGGKKGDREVFRATRWMPLEISIVSIPADTSVGVGRAMPTESAPVAEPIIIVKENSKMENIDSVKVERERVAAIMDLATRHGQREFGDQAIREGASIEQFRGALLDKVASKPLALDNEVGLTEQEVRSFSFVKAIRALANPQDRAAQEAARFEFEVSEAAAKKEGRTSRGLLVPVDVLYKRDITDFNCLWHGEGWQPCGDRSSRLVVHRRSA